MPYLGEAMCAGGGGIGEIASALDIYQLIEKSFSSMTTSMGV